MRTAEPVFWAVVPAAGKGTRLGEPIPKQYLTIAGQPLLHHTLRRLAQTPGLRGIVVVLAADDAHWAKTQSQLDLAVPLHTVVGGQERADSVLAGTRWLKEHLATPLNCWVLVHDAARPGVRPEDVRALMAYCQAHNEGAILALPARDTIKQSGAGQHAQPPHITATLDRSRIWLAQTPQCFPLDDLINALTAALPDVQQITDEASAMSLAGFPVGLVRGHWQNNKLTEPDDWPLIEWVLQHDD